MHIFQTVCNVGQLNRTSVRLVQWRVTHELNAVDVAIPLDEVIDVPILHPLRNQGELVFAHRHSKERQDVGMSEVFPRNSLSTESLGSRHSDTCGRTGRELTLRMRSRSLVTYTRTILTATRRPSYVLRDTLANPPDSTSTEPSEQSGISMDFGTTWCWLHVLQSLLNNFSRSGSGTVRSSRSCSSRYPSGMRIETLKNLLYPSH